MTVVSVNMLKKDGIGIGILPLLITGNLMNRLSVIWNSNLVKLNLIFKFSIIVGEKRQEANNTHKK
jgi:hypothetical protein